MGKANSKLSPEQLAEMQKITYFDKKELQQWYRGFLKDCPSGQMDRIELQRLYKQFFPFGDPSRFVDFIFPLFDTDKNGVVDFKLYDMNRDGFISKEELLKVVDAIYRMVGNMTKLPPDEETPEKRVDKIFAYMDKDADGRLSLQEFQQGSRSDPTLIQCLSMYEGVI